MATLSVFRNQSPHKLHILQESINNADNTSSKPKREIVILRKKPKIINTQQAVSVTSLINQNILLEAPKKKTKQKEAIGKVQNPPPVAVARRNARERNRVKQVNNGFATLRQHIPNEIAEIFENSNNNRAANKKLSKVETLRMAVEYIRSLENILSIDENKDSNLSLSSYPSPASSESLQNGSSFEQGYYSLQSPLEDEDSNPATPLPSVTPHRFTRLPGTNTFHLIQGMNYEDEENVHPLTPNSDMLPQEDMIIQSNVEYIQTIPQEFTVIHPNMLSPNFYSENSLSPNQNQELLDIKYVQSINMIPSHHQIVYQPQLVLNHQQMMVQANMPKIEKCSPLKLTDQVIHSKIVYSVDGDMKQEPSELDGSFHREAEQDDDMDDVITWWENEGQHEDES